MMEDLAKLTKEEEEILMLTEEIWNRLWINPEDMMRIEPLLKGGDRI